MKTWMLLFAVTTSLGLFGCPDKESATADPSAAKDASAAPAAAKPGPAPAAAKASGGW